MDLAGSQRKLAASDQAAFAQFYWSQQPSMLRYATGLLAGDRSSAEDVVDEAFLAIWRDAAPQAPIASPQAWLRRIVRNKAIDHLRRSNRCPLASEAQLLKLMRTPDRHERPDEAAENNSSARELRRTLQRLSPEHREVIWLCYYEEMPLSEIAFIVGCPENTVKTRLFHARKAMRAHFRR